MDAFSQALINFAEKTEPNKADGDYIENGLLHCGKCHTPKQCELSVAGQVIRPYCMCKCEEEQNTREAKYLKRILQTDEIERNRHSGFKDGEMKHCRFELDDRKNPKISDISRRYVEHFDTMYQKGKGLIYFGNAGTGKSFLAACITNALIDRGYKCLMTSFPRIINEVSGLYEGKQEYIDSLNGYDLLVIDDMAVERDTEYTAEIVQNVIDSRYRAGKPLIVTTNITKQDYESPTTIQKERLYSRLHEMCLPLAVTGQDRRKANAAIRDDELKGLLGI